MVARASGPVAVRRLGLALILAVALAAPAHAEVRLLGVEAVPPVVPPDAGASLVTARFEVDCTSLLARLPPGTTSGLVVQVAYASTTLVLDGPPSVQVPTEPCQGALAVPFQAAVNARVPLAVPGLVAQPGTISVQLPASPLDELDPPTAQAAFEVTPSALVSVVARFGEGGARGEAGATTFHVQLENAGNVPFEVTGTATMEVLTKKGAGTAAEVRVGSATLAPGEAGGLDVVADEPTGAWTYMTVHGTLSVQSASAPGQAPQAFPFSYLVENPVADKGSPGAGIPGSMALLVAAAARAWRRRPAPDAS